VRRRRFQRMCALTLLALLPSHPAWAQAPRTWTGEELDARASAPEGREWLPARAGEQGQSGQSARMIHVNSCPFGAEVFRGGVRLGVTPLWVSLPDPKGDSLLVAYPGYRTVKIAPHVLGEGALEIRLSPIRPDPGLGVSPGSRTGGSILDAWVLRWGLFLVGAGSAGLGLHFKGRADDAYAEYLRTGHPARMRQAFDRAERYDRLALGGWVAAEVSLAGFLYLVMRSARGESWGLRAAVGEAAGGPSVGVGWRF